MYNTKYIDEQFVDEFKGLAEKSHFSNGKLEAKEYVDAIVLPFLNGRGGVLNNRREYIEESALHAEHIMENPYEVEKVSKLNETTIYLGLFIKQWGHFLVDFVPRLWYLINNDSDLRLVYVSVGNQEINGVFAEFLSVFGIDTKRLTCIKNPTEFTKLIIPQTSYERPYRYYTEYKSIFDYMHSKIDELNLSYQRYEKIYWTRTRLKKARKTETGEKVIEKLFEANGYKVLSPEKLSLKEQLFYFSTCKKMAGISGTIPHNLLFSDSNTEFVILNRTYRINVNQFPINELSGAKVVYIDCRSSMVEPPVRALCTTTCRSMRSLSAPTWEMMPTSRSPSVRPESTRMASSNDSSSSEPKPSSKNKVSSRMPPALLCTSSERPSASASEALKLSPPERVFTLRRVPL